LDGIYDLQGCIAPEHQRQGLGSVLLNFLLAELQGSDVRQLSHMVNSTDTPAAQFLHRHGFFAEHEECILSLNDLSQLSPGQIPPGYTLRTFSRPAATRHFRRLYDLVFANLPWYQPYRSDREVAADLVDPADLLFLLDNQTPIGFLWVRWPELERGEIEPVGILPAYQRQGLGRRLMLAALHQMAEQGAREVALGVWNNNVVALDLYRSLGFRQSLTVIYLALNLNYR
jgi:mycothiol synthase